MALKDPGPDRLAEDDSPTRPAPGVRAGDGDLRDRLQHDRRGHPDHLGAHGPEARAATSSCSALWVVGGLVALCGALTPGRTLGGAAAIGRRIRHLPRGLRAAPGLPGGLGLVPVRLLGPDRRGGLGRVELPAGPSGARRRPTAVARPGSGHRRDPGASPRSTPRAEGGRPGSRGSSRSLNWPSWSPSSSPGWSPAGGHWANLDDRPPIGPARSGRSCSPWSTSPTDTPAGTPRRTSPARSTTPPGGSPGRSSWGPGSSRPSISP